MKLLSGLFILAFTTVSFGSQVCKTAEYNFVVTKTNIAFSEHGGHTTKLKVVQHKTLSKNSADFRSLIESMLSDLNAEPISQTEAESINKFSMTIAKGKNDIVDLAYTIAKDKNGKTIVRYVLTEGGYFRCL